MQEQIAWVQSACARVLRPLVRLALSKGLRYPQFDELLRQLMLEEAERLWKEQGVSRPNLSQLSVTTGLNRKAVTTLVRTEPDALPATESSSASKTFTLWLQMMMREPAMRRLPIVAEGDAPSFEKLAREAGRGNWHHRSILDELLRLRLVQEAQGHAELLADGFVPQGDLQTLMAFMGDNARDHLMAATSNVEGERAPLLERAVYAKGLSMEDCEAIEAFVRQRWTALHHELTEKMTRAVDVADGKSAGRIRVGIYTYFEDTRQGAGGGETQK